jgi:hypothetical protein
MKEEFLPEFDLDLEDVVEDVVEEKDSAFNDEVEETDSTEKDYGDDADDNAIAAYQYYVDNGLLTDEYEFDGTFDSLMTGLSKQLETYQHQVYDNLINSSPEFARPLIELSLLKGENFTMDEMMEVLNAVKPSEYTMDSLKEEGVAVSYLTELYKSEGYSDDEIEDKIDFLKDRDLLAKEATSIFKKESKYKGDFVKSKVDSVKQEIADEEQRQQRLVQDFANEIKGAKWSASKQKQVFDEFTTGTFKGKVEKALENPKALMQLVDLMTYFDGEKFDYDKLKKQFSDAGEVKKKIANYWQGDKMKSSQPAGKRKMDDDLTNFELIFD